MVTFNYPEWSTLFPEFASTVNSAQAQLYFNQATLFLSNSDACNLVPDDSLGGERDSLLNMLTAHIAQLLAGSSKAPAGPFVGRISNASEGSVSVAIQSDYPAGTVQWYQQTPYGSMYWAATAKYRTMRYMPGRSRAAGWAGRWPFVGAGGFWGPW